MFVDRIRIAHASGQAWMINWLCELKEIIEKESVAFSRKLQFNISKVNTSLINNRSWPSGTQGAPTTQTKPTAVLNW